METLTNETNPPIAEPVAVEFGETDVATAMSAYLEFLELPEEVKNRVWYQGDERRNTSAGYVRKGEGTNGRVDSSQDKKFVFHYSPDVGQLVQNFDKTPPAAVTDFIEVAQGIWEQAAAATRLRLAELEETYPMLVGIHFNPSGATNHHLRFLAYEGNGDGMLASGHYDKSTLTLALAESHGGLRVAEQPEQLEVYERDPDQPLLFHGLGWLKLIQQLGDTTDIMPAWHDVIEVADKRINEQIMRWALIFFANPAYMDTAPSKDETHTPLSPEVINTYRRTHTQRLGQLARV